MSKPPPAKPARSRGDDAAAATSAEAGPSDTAAPSSPPPADEPLADSTMASESAAPSESAPATAAPAAPAGPELSPAEKMLNRRTKICGELLDTERTYVTSLKILGEVYIRPLRFNAQTSPNPIAPKESLDAIFSNVELITKTNETLLASLEERMATWDPTTTCIGDIMKRMAPFLKLYSQYCQNYDNSLKTVAQCSQSSQFSAFLTSGHLHPDSQNLHLADCLIMPVQRIPRYIMLLDDLIKHTTEEHPDKAQLVAAKSTISEIAVIVNHSMAVAANLTRIVEIQQNLSKDAPILVEPHRRFIKEGYLTKNRDKRMYFLFNDIIVYASKASSTMFAFKGLVPLNTTWIQDVAEDETGFLIVSTKKTYQVNAETPDGKAQWMAALNAQIDAAVLADPSLVKKRASANVVQRGRFRRGGRRETVSTDESYLTAAALPSSITVEVLTPQVSFRALRNSNAEHVGQLFKTGSGVFSKWNERFFVLKDKFLYYFKSEADEEPTGVVPLDGCVVESRQDISKKGKFFFDISHTSRDRVFHIYAKDAATRSEWTNDMLRSINGPLAVSDLGMPYVAANIAHGSLIVKEQALQMLVRLLRSPATITEQQRIVIESRDCRNILEPLMMATNVEGPIRVLALECLRRLTFIDAAKAFLCIENHGLIDFAAFVLCTKDRAAVFQAGWLLLNLLASTTPAGDLEEENSVVVPLMLLLEQASFAQSVMDQVAIACEALAADGFTRKDFLSVNALPVIVDVIREAKSTDTCLRSLARTIAYLAVNDSVRAQLPNLGAIPPLVKLVSSRDPGVVEAAIHALGGVASVPLARALMVDNAFIGPVIAQIEVPGTPGTRYYAVECLRAFAAAASGRGQLLDAGLLPVLVSVLRQVLAESKVLASLVGLFANVCEGGSDIIKAAMFELGGVELLLSLCAPQVLIDLGLDSPITKEALLRALTNTAQGFERTVDSVAKRTETVSMAVADLRSTNERIASQASALAAALAEFASGARMLHQCGAVGPLVETLVAAPPVGSTPSPRLVSLRRATVTALARLCASTIVVAQVRESGKRMVVDDVAFCPDTAAAADARKLAELFDLTLTPPAASTLASAAGLTPPATGATAVLGLAVVVAAWSPTSANEIALEVGGLVALHDTSNAAWWYGTVDGASGFFPAASVETQADSFTGRARTESRTLEEHARQTGWLKLQSTSVMRSWVRHYGILELGVFRLYKTVQDPDPAVEMDLKLATVKPLADVKPEGTGFEIVSMAKKVALMAESKEEATSWMTALQDAIARSLRDVASSEPAGAGGRAKRAKNMTQEQMNALMRALWALDGNAVCADCYNAKPDWCAINLGVMMCIECSGLHRSLGTHISKVRSLKLDDLPLYIREFLFAIGNARFNAVYESWAARVKKYKPSDASLAGMRTQFVRYKYTEKRVMLAPEPAPSPDELGQELLTAVDAGDAMGVLRALALGADPSWTIPSSGLSVLMHAVAQPLERVRDVFTCLVLNGASLKSRAPSSNDSLAHAAVRAGAPLFLSILLENDVAIAETRNADNQTPQQLAESLGRASCLAVFAGEWDEDTGSNSYLKTLSSSGGSGGIGGSGGAGSAGDDGIDPPPPMDDDAGGDGGAMGLPGDIPPPEDVPDDLFDLIDDDATPAPPPRTPTADSLPPPLPEFGAAVAPPVGGKNAANASAITTGSMATANKRDRPSMLELPPPVVAEPVPPKPPRSPRSTEGGGGAAAAASGATSPRGAAAAATATSAQPASSSGPPSKPARKGASQGAV